MKKLFLVLLALLLSAPGVWAQYDETYPEHNGMTAVRKGKKIGYVNTEGVEVVPCKYAVVGSFNRMGLAWVYDGSRFGVYHRSGRMVVPVKFKALGYFTAERSPDAVLASTQDVADKYFNAYKDKIGALDLHGYKYLELEPFSELPLDFSPYIVVSRNASMAGDGIVDSVGGEVVPVGRFDRVYMPTEGFVPVAILARNNTKHIRYPKKLDESEHQSYAVEKVLSGKGSGTVYDVNYYDSATKKLLFKKWLQSNLVSPFINGRALIVNRDVSFFVSTDGQQVGNLYANVYPSSGSYMVARDANSLYYIVDMAGNKTTDSFQFLSPVEDDDRLEARENGNKLFGLLSVDGEWVVRSRFEQFGTVRHGFFCVKENGKWGVVDAEGKQIVPCRWHDECAPQRKGQSLFWVKTEEKGLWHCYSVSSQSFAFSDGYNGVRNFDQDIKGCAIVQIANGKLACIDTLGAIVYPFVEDRVSAVKSAVRRRFSDGHFKWTSDDQKHMELRRDATKKKYDISKPIPSQVWDY